MRWRMKSTEFQRSTKKQRSEKLQLMVKQDIPIGVLAYADDIPVGWCSIAPRETCLGLERYRALPRIDREDVWSVVCFFIDSKFRRKGLTFEILVAARDYAKSCGARIIEGYPVSPLSKSYTYMGSPNTFRRAGFHDVTPIGQKRAVVHYYCY